MRVLIVDDDPQKVILVKGCLTDLGVAVGDILVAEHAAAARILLEREAIDLLLLDVLLPARSGATPKGETSIELLRQIVDDGTTPAAKAIVGITADADTRAAFDGEFKNLVMQVLHVAPGEGAWRDAIRSMTLFSERVEASAEAYNYDICVLNALRSPELQAVYESWPLTLGEEHTVRKNISCRTGTLQVNGVGRRIVCGHLPQMGPIAATHGATALLAEFRPRLLLMTGICGGFSDVVRLGDVLVAEKSWDWQAGKWKEDGTLASASDQRDAAPDLVAHARATESALTSHYDAYTGRKPKVSPRLVVGPLVTGSSVVASKDIQKVFRGQHRKMAGVDMECYGIYYAAENHPGAAPRTLCIKAVSDLANRTKNDGIQPFCSHISAMVALDVIRRHFNNAA